MAQLTDAIVKNIVRRLIHGEDYRIEIVSLINTEFLQYAIDFFRRVVEAKLKNQAVTADWYKAEFLNPDAPVNELIIHSGLNRKTISNRYNSSRKEIVLEAAQEHYELLYAAINDLVKQENDGIDVTLTIKLRGVSVDLNINESLVVINTLAVKRAALRGGAWSAAGKQTEKALMRTLCKLYDVPDENYALTGRSGEEREVDFYLIGREGKRYLCEVKLMGKGNPESADATIARDSDVFIADKLSDLNKRQLTRRNVQWVELRSPNGYAQFQTVLEALEIPHRPLKGGLDKRLEEILSGDSV